MATGWENRIVGYAEVDPETLLANPLNYRIHPALQQGAVLDSLKRDGWLKPVLVDRDTDTVVDGHLRVSLAIREGQAAVPVLYLALSVEEVRRALLTLDTTVAMGGTDAGLLRELLGDVEADGVDLGNFGAYLATTTPKSRMKKGGAGSDHKPARTAFMPPYQSESREVTCPNCGASFYEES